jgi:hypothetical protein
LSSKQLSVATPFIILTIVLPGHSPFKILRSISLEGHLLLLSGWLAWTCDGYDYFSVSLTAKLLAKQFDKSTTAIVSAHYYQGEPILTVS